LPNTGSQPASAADVAHCEKADPERSGARDLRYDRYTPTAPATTPTAAVTLDFEDASMSCQDIGSGTDAGSRHITTRERRYADYTLSGFGMAITVGRALMASSPGIRVHAIKTANALGDDFFRVEFQRVGALVDCFGSTAPVGNPHAQMSACCHCTFQSGRSGLDP
jgi:hypothetical protein